MRFKKNLSVGELMLLFLLVLAFIFPKKTPNIEPPSTSSVDEEVVQIDSIHREIELPRH